MASTDCKNLKTPNDLLKCIVEHHTDMKVLRSQVKSKMFSVELASQRINPQVEFEALDKIGKGFSLESSLVHTFEFGNKRYARTLFAKSETELLKTDFLKYQEEITIETVKNLYRIRQIDHEIQIIQEIIKTFLKITQQYAQAGQLAPEDEISISVFKMALEENKLKNNALVNEKKEIIEKIQMSISQKLIIEKMHLPKIKKRWPKLAVMKLSGSQLLQISKKLKLANANYQLQKSNSSQNLSIGPKIEIERDQQTETKIGITLSIPLPVFSSNAPGVDQSLSEISSVTLQNSVIRNRLERKKNYYYEVYKRVSATLNNSLTKKQVVLKNKNIHKIIERGVVSAPIIIEFHRQTMNYFETLHQQELVVVHAFWTIAALEGRILKEKLN